MFRAKYLLSVVFLSQLAAYLSRHIPIECRDPDVGGTAQNRDRKFMVLGSADAGGAGLGNLLIFFPAAFYFAAVTGRDIVIQDRSVLGEMCSVVQCGFPFVDQVSLAFPDILNENSILHADNVKAQDFTKYIEGHRKIESKVIRAAGYLSKSDWWVWFNTTVNCVHRITGCDLGDVMCAERHAYQRLIRGPFRSGLTAEEEKRIHGVPTNMKHAILTLPHSYAPRLDAAVHLRAQFYHFEQQANVNDPAYRKEVEEWMNGTESQQVFQSMRGKLLELVTRIRPNTFSDSSISGRVGNNSVVSAPTNIDPVYIYIAADNEDVKEAFCKILRDDPAFKGLLRIMRVETKGVMHVKNLAKLKDAINNEGLLDLVFDWYALSLANNIYAWRKGSTNMLSTFVHSAQKVSGTTERTDNNQGKGIGTRGYQLIKDKRGNMKFDLFWVYTFMEDFQIKS